MCYLGIGSGLKHLLIARFLSEHNSFVKSLGIFGLSLLLFLIFTKLLLFIFDFLPLVESYFFLYKIVDHVSSMLSGFQIKSYSAKIDSIIAIFFKLYYLVFELRCSSLLDQGLFRWNNLL